MQRRSEGKDGPIIRILLVCSFFVGLLMMAMGVVFRVYVCHWVAKAMFGGWIGIIIMMTAGVGILTRVSHSYGPRHGPAIVLAMSFVTFVLCLVMTACLAFAMKDFNDDKWFRVPKPYLVVNPDHCVVERHVNRYYYYKTIKEHGRDGLKYGSILIGIALLQMFLTVLTALFIGRLKEYYGKGELVKNPEPMANTRV